MPENNSIRQRSSVVLVLIDVINHFEFPDGDKILKNTLPIADRLAKLKKQCRRAGIPSNDDYFVLKPMHSASFQMPLEKA